MSWLRKYQEGGLLNPPKTYVYNGNKYTVSDKGTVTDSNNRDVTSYAQELFPELLGGYKKEQPSSSFVNIKPTVSSLEEARQMATKYSIDKGIQVAKQEKTAQENQLQKDLYLKRSDDNLLTQAGKQVTDFGTSWSTAPKRLVNTAFTVLTPDVINDTPQSYGQRVYDAAKISDEDLWKGRIGTPLDKAGMVAEGATELALATMPLPSVKNIKIGAGMLADDFGKLINKPKLNLEDIRQAFWNGTRELNSNEIRLLQREGIGSSEGYLPENLDELFDESIENILFRNRQNYFNPPNISKLETIKNTSSDDIKRFIGQKKYQFQTGEFSPRSIYYKHQDVFPEDKLQHALFGSPEMALKYVSNISKELPAGRRFGEKSLSSDSFPLVLGQATRKVRNKEADLIFTGRYNPLNSLGKKENKFIRSFDNQGVNEYKKFIDDKIDYFNSNTGQKLPKSKIINHQLHVPDFIIEKHGATLSDKVNRHKTMGKTLGKSGAVVGVSALAGNVFDNQVMEKDSPLNNFLENVIKDTPNPINYLLDSSKKQTGGWLNNY